MSRRIDRPFKKGKQIKTLRSLVTAVMNKESVITDFNIMMPAGWVFQMQGQIIYQYMRRGLYIYKGLKR